MSRGSIDIPVISKFDATGLKQAQKGLQGFGKQLGGIALAIGAAFSVRAIGNFAKESVLAAEAAATAQSRLEAVAKATGVFGAQTEQVTDRLGEFAKSQEMRLAVDDKVIKGVQAQLLSFKALGASADEVGGAFDRATVAAFDMAAAGFGSAEGNATALGKALENPIKGVTALARMGTTFTDQQREQIRVLQESGDLLGAQELILAEVESQYGGVAAATADASDKLGIAFDNIKETAGAALLPVFAEIVEGLMPVTEAIGTELAATLESLSPVLMEIANMIPGLLTAFMPLIPILGVLAGLFLEMVAQLLPVFVKLFEQLLPVILELAPILADVFLQVLEALLPVFMEIIDALMPIVVALLPVLAQLIISLAPVIITLVKAFLPLIEEILPHVISLIEFLTPILVFIGELIGVVLVAAVGFFIAAFENVQEFFEKFGPVFQNIFIGLQIVFATVINAMISGFENFINFFVRGFNTLVRGINMIRREFNQEEFALAAEVQFGRVEVPELIPLAAGGIVTGPTSALIGEAGPEAVIPLSKMGSMGNTYNITINANVADSRLGEVVVNAIKRYERSSGPVFAKA
jgi:phage-related protein